MPCAPQVQSGEGFKKARQFLALEPLDDEVRAAENLGPLTQTPPKNLPKNVGCPFQGPQ